jgi:hypothetical protein
MIKKWLLLTLVIALFPISNVYALDVESTPTPTPTTTPTPTPTVESTPTPKPESTDKDIPISESNPSWLLDQEKQFYAKTTVATAATPVPNPTKYYRYIQTTPTPSPTPLIAQNSTQVKGTSSAIAYKNPSQQKSNQHSIAFLALVSVVVSLAAIILSRILKPKTIR